MTREPVIDRKNDLLIIENHELRTEIERCREEQRAVLKHVEELRISIELIKKAFCAENARLQAEIKLLRAEPKP